MSKHCKGRGKYGYFSEETREYIITRPDTPTPWINYIGWGGFGGIVSNTGGGYSFYRDPRHRRVTRYRYNAIPADQPGRYIYLRDMETGDFWSPTWQPVKRSLDSYECHHGAGYTKIKSTYRGIESEVLYFVPPDAPCELWVLSLRNLENRPQKLRTFTYAEFSLPDAVTDQTNLDWGGQIARAEMRDGVIWVVSQAMPIDYFFASSVREVGFDTDRETFVGSYRDLSNPVVVERGEPSNSLASRGNVIGSLCHEIDMHPNAERRIVFILGSKEEGTDPGSIIGRYKSIAAVNKAFRELRNDWISYLNTLSVETPDSQMNAMLNVWNPIQCRATLYWSRFVSGYETGLGRGMGTRDSSQDTLGVAHSAPEHVRKTLEMLWKLQFLDGHAWHLVYPLTGEGASGLAAEKPDYPQWFSDDHLWLIFGTCNYLRETGDLDFLDLKVPYQDGSSESIWDHIGRAVKFTDTHRGIYGLPRIGFSDWNDTLQPDRGSGKAASVWTAMFFCRVMSDLSELCKYAGHDKEAKRYQDLREDMSARINKYAWDGAWYVRAYDDEGKVIGSHRETYQQISLNTQTWAVISGVAPPERAKIAMESAHRRLNTKYGFALMAPAYREYDPRIGGTTTYPPGAKENGGIFCHAHAWAIIAAAMLGWGDRAYTYYRQILPLVRNDDADLYGAEPYVYCQNILGPEHPGFGRGFNSWLTGTATWSYVAATQYILGVRPSHEGLVVDPCIPKGWSGFRVTRCFRGATYDIEVRNPDGVSRGVRSVTVDGKPLEGNVLPIFDDGKVHKVVVIMG
ncbi:MAG: glycosyl transferase family 36 [Hadesarchaea archaeon]|nr:glycosyl transferase family 36 [Hadesarchaea archaeon]